MNNVSCIEQFRDQLFHDWAPGDGKTWCNKFAEAVCIAMQVPFPDGLLANEQHAYLENPINGWRQVSRVLAQDNALHGKPTLVTRPNPTGHGHIAVVRPEAINGDVYIAQAGRENFLIGRLQRGFGALSVTYWIKE